MEIVSLGDAPGYDSSSVVAQPLLEGSQCNVRIIRLSPGQALPPHTHGVSDLMIYAVEGEGTIATDAGTVPFAAGSLAYLRGDEELRVANIGESGLTLLAVPRPAVPPSPAELNMARLSVPVEEGATADHCHERTMCKDWVQAVLVGIVGFTVLGYTAAGRCSPSSR